MVLLSAGLALAFPDVPPGSDYSEAIEELSGLGIIGGFQDGTFGPTKPVTRQQFAKMIVLTLDLPVSEADVCAFRDVQIGGYSDPFFPDNYIAVAADRGITKGTSDPTKFNPSGNITRAQVMTMFVRAGGMVGVTLSQPASSYYSDSTKIMRAFNDANHGLNAQIAESSGLLWGIRLDRAGVWDPWMNATRGEVAQILWRLSQKFTSTLPKPQLLFSDSFSDPTSGLTEADYSNSAMGYTPGSYYIDVWAADWAAGSWYGSQYDDAYAEVWAYSESSSTDWNYGFMFRVQDFKNFYLLSVYGDDTAVLWKKVNDQWTQLSGIADLGPVPAENDSWRHLEVVMVGSNTFAYVDDVYVGEFTDTTFAQGKLGFYVGTFDTPDLTTYFDDFAVWGIVY